MSSWHGVLVMYRDTFTFYFIVVVGYTLQASIIEG
jgi:hypothetical protein